LASEQCGDECRDAKGDRPLWLWLHDWLLDTWYGGSRRGRWLLPAAWLFAGIAGLRRTLYRAGPFRPYRSPRPVVVVGNITAGGTGKTPFVAWLAGELARRGLHPGIASRGYGGTEGPARLLTDADSAATSGDEPFLLRRRLGMPVAIGSRRREAVRLLERHCDLILCDDGLQHHALARDVEIAVVDGSRGVGNGRLLPAGPLREPASRLAAVDAVVVNGEGFDWPSAIRMRLEPVALVPIAGGAHRPLADFEGSRVRAIAAIGNPERFFALLRGHGLVVSGQAFRDHAVIAPTDVAVPAGTPIVMTEKDAVKCTNDEWRDAWYLEIAAQVEGDAARRLVDRIAALAVARRDANE
jgi:tetraacyldisaccharide 4'-kinase